MKTMSHGAKPELPELPELPEGCKATIISFTSPQDACRLSSVSRNFKSAAESDTAWGKFLPPEMYTILSQSSAPELAARSKKEIYFALCDNPVLIHQGRMSFSLDKRKGKKCFMISARNLWIVWGDISQYWIWISHLESRFDEVAELLNVCWLQIVGNINIRLLSASTLYKAYLVFRFTAEAHGFAHLTVEVTVGLVGTEATRKTVFLHSQELMDGDQYPKQRSDGWWEIELGEVFCEGEDKELVMTFLASEITQWKRGLIVQGIEIRP
ncbi:hypothetical protein M0R45_000288 [Rubus argutus]|uniref:F-box domain-containing protein n=1 Tax=Rubus argutus TaxID=59490 RepID=A0AAW1VPR0_RUBAR